MRRVWPGGELHGLGKIIAAGDWSAVVATTNATASGQASAVVGGDNGTASGASAIAIGENATAPNARDIAIGGATCQVGFLGALPIARPTVVGSRAANAALASLVQQLAALGLVTDGTTP